MNLTLRRRRTTALVIRWLRALCFTCLLLGGSLRAAPLIPLGEAAWRAAENLEAHALKKPMGRSSEYFLSSRTPRERAVAASVALPAGGLTAPREASSSHTLGESGSAFWPEETGPTPIMGGCVSREVIAMAS